MNDDPTKPDAAIDSNLISYWSKSTCYKRGDGSEPTVKEQCKGVCFPRPADSAMAASTCWFGTSKWLDGSSGKELEDQTKNIPGTCNYEFNSHCS
jgi:hypothetical protein